MTDSNPGLFDLTGRTALVTGSSRGIGQVLAGGLAKAGAHLVLHGRDEAPLAAAPAAAEADIGGIDILVNNAGIQVARARIIRGRGKIINLGSVQTQLGRPGIAPYAATKGGASEFVHGQILYVDGGMTAVV